MASIPNPLFDLAGLTCGHLLIPFCTFFVATMIGKAIVKVHIQLVCIIFAFKEGTIKVFLGYVSKYVSEGVAKRMFDVMEAQKSKLQKGGIEEEDEAFNFVGFVWNSFLMVMIVYFVCSVVNSVAKDYYNKQKIKSENQKIKKNTKKKDS
jgi:hypothetical protein